MRRLRIVLAVPAGLALMTAISVGQAGRWRERGLERLEARADAKGPHGRALAADERAPGPGLYEVVLPHDGLARRYLLHVPRSAIAGRPLPMVLALHGGGGSMRWQADDANYGLRTAADAHGFIAVFPNGYSARDSGQFATWNAGRCCGAARDRDIDDVGFLRAVIADVLARTGGDAARVHAVGMSNGAMMAYRLACEAPELLAGIMAVAGTDNTRECRPARPVPVLHVHARDDDRVPFEGGVGTAFRDTRRVTDFRSVPSTIEAWVARDRAAATADVVVEVPGARCVRHAALPGGAPVQLCVTDSGGHGWPGGGGRRGKAAPSTAIHANELMWAFFRTLDGPDRRTAGGAAPVSS